MLRFNELRIDSLKNLIIDVSVNDVLFDTYKLATINSVNIGFGKNTECEFNYNATTLRTVATITEEGASIRGFRLIMPLSTAIGYNNDLVYVFIGLDVDGISTSVPCYLNTSIEGYVYDKCLLYNKVFDYIKNTSNDCYDINAYANLITQIKGLELAVESGNFTLANKYWNKFFSNNNTTTTNNCNCNG